MSKRVLAAVLMLAVFGAVAVRAQEGGDAVRGAALYAENCQACHGPQGEAGAAHEAFAATIQYSDDFTEVVAQGVNDTYMRPWGEAFGGPLSDADLAGLRAYAQTWNSGETPPLPTPEVPTGLEALGRGDPSLGAALYLENCAGCHGPTGEGRDLEGFPAIDPEADVLTATRRGAGKWMPPFAQVNGGPLSEGDLENTGDIDNIMAYVRTWERPSALEVAAASSPEGAGMLILLIGIGAVLLVGGVVLVRRSVDGG